jgi:hypothetical protein
MSADKLRKASSSGVAAVALASGTRAIGATTLSVGAGGLLNWATTTSVDFTTYTLTDGVISDKCEWTGKADPDNDIITDMELTNGTDTGNSANDVVICVETAAWVNDVIDTLLTVFDQTGSLKANSVTGTAIINQAISTVKLADTAVTIDKLATAARQQVLDADGTTEVVFSTASVQPAAQPGKTIIWFAPS